MCADIVIAVSGALAGGKSVVDILKSAGKKLWK
jgi:hypothetical protein